MPLPGYRFPCWPACPILLETQSPLRYLARSAALHTPQKPTASATHEMFGLGLRAQAADSLRSDSSRGPLTAWAVTLLHALDAAARHRGTASSSLDDVMRLLAESNNDITISALRAAAECVIGAPSRTPGSDEVDDCH